MGVRCHIYLPPDVGPKNAGSVIGILAGLKSHKRFFEDGKGGWYAEVCGVTESPSDHSIGFGELLFGGKMIDGQTAHSVYFHHGNRFYGGIYNCVSAASTPFWCAIGLRMVRFFGGICVYNDCDQTKKAGCFKRRCPVDSNGFLPHDGRGWFEYHQALLDMKPVTPEEIREAREFCGYAREYETDGITEKKEAKA